MAPVWLQAARLSVTAGFPRCEDHQVERIELIWLRVSKG